MSGGESPCRPSTGTLGSLQDPQSGLEVTAHGQGQGGPSRHPTGDLGDGAQHWKEGTAGVSLCRAYQILLRKPGWAGTQGTGLSQSVGLSLRVLDPYGGVKRVSEGPVPAIGHSPAIILAPPPLPTPYTQQSSFPFLREASGPTKGGRCPPRRTWTASVIKIGPVAAG